MKNYGALILAIGGTTSALVQSLGYVREPGMIMLVTNLITIALTVLGWWLARRKNRLALASGKVLDALARNVGCERFIGEPDASLRRRVMREMGVQERAWRP